MKGFKAFHKDMTCNGFQYKEGETYEHDGKLKICSSGFHFCENPLDVLNYYNLCDSEFAEVEALGETVTHDGDSKVATTKIQIGAKLSLSGFIKASVDFILKTCKPGKDYSKLAASGDYSQLAASGHYSKLAASGHYSKLAASGDYSQLAASGHSSKLAASGHYSQLAASGHYSQLAASGDYSQLEINGADSIGAAIGINNVIKGKKGCWITLAEWKWNDKKDRWLPVCVKSAQIDGKKLKADTWYQLVGGEFKEVE
jgi:hypothetical protein